MRTLTIITIGFVLVLLAFLAVLLVGVDKPHFGWLVGWGFLPTIEAGVFVGGIMMLIGTLFLPQRWTWRGITLILWSLIALTSPLFGFMFLFPWGFLAITAPLVIWILLTLRRQAR